MEGIFHDILSLLDQIVSSKVPPLMDEMSPSPTDTECSSVLPARLRAFDLYIAATTAYSEVLRT